LRSASRLAHDSIIEPDRRRRRRIAGLGGNTMTDSTAKTVSRRKFLRGSAVAAGTAAAGTLAAPAVLAQAPQTLRMQTSWPVADVFMDMAKQYTDRIEALSGGKLKIDLLPAGAVVQAFQVQDAVNDGVLDAAHTVPAYWYGKHKAASLFGTGPVWGWGGSHVIAWLHYGGGKELYRELVQDVLGLNLVGFFCMPMPEQPLGWFKEQITDVSQLQGLKYRTVGLSTDVNQQLGLAVTQLPGGEIVPALERGVIEAFEYNNPTSDMRFGAADVSKHYMLGSFHQAAEMFEIIVNRDLYESLEPGAQAAFEYGAEAANTANFGFAMNQYAADLQKLIADGVNVYRTPESVLQAQLEAWDKVVEQISGQDEFFAKVIDSQKNWFKDVGYYWHMNQAGYELAYRHYYPDVLPEF
jgi:TRAP-type mannitol/chloroaromatic compound transport system substrate-binding protein